MPSCTFLRMIRNICFKVLLISASLVVTQGQEYGGESIEEETTWYSSETKQFIHVGNVPPARLVIKHLQAEMIVSSDSENIPKLRPNRQAPPLQARRLDCTDIGGIGTCIRHKAMMQCDWPSVQSICPRSCNVCDYSEWELWGPWSECSVTCSSGVLVRSRTCLQVLCRPAPSVDMLSCQRPACNLVSVRGRASSTVNIYDPQEKVTEENNCAEDEFACPKSKRCFDTTFKCDGENDCGTGDDEKKCNFGLRGDGKFGIINWKYHKCAEANTTATGGTIPTMYRRCPGHYNKYKESFTWSWLNFNNLQHMGTQKCLTVNVTVINATKVPNTMDLILATCDDYDLTQQWMCIGSQVRVVFPYKVLPEPNLAEMYLKVSDDGPGNKWVLTSTVDETTEFYMHGTNKRLNICAKRDYGPPNKWAFWSLCDKSCGGGISKKKRACALNGDMSCGGGDLYETRPCNSHPCIVICPPEFTVHISVHNPKDINCFKVFDKRKTVADAQKFCAARNWTLAADKDSITHKLLLEMLKKIPQAYIGVHEDLAARLQPPYPHLFRYHWDGQLMGGFQPWYQYSDELRNLGCTVGFGSTYHGSMSFASGGLECEEWNSTVSDENDVKESSLLNLIASYEVSSLMIDNNYCRNPDLSEDSPWCRLRNKENTIYKKTCDIPDCLDMITVKSVPENRDMFLILSLDGEPNFCIAVLSTDRVVTTECDCEDNRQNFYWWAGISLVNAAYGKCLTAGSLPPKHGDEIYVEKCSIIKSRLNQGWRTNEHEISLAWTPDFGNIESDPPLYSLEHHRELKMVFIADNRRELFTVWNPTTGMLRMNELFGATPAGNYFLLKGFSCDVCVKSVIDSRQLTSDFCNKRDVHQRWIKLRRNILMNVATGLCLSSYKMRFYVLLEECDAGNNRIHWTILPGSEDVVTLQHFLSEYFLTCACTGYTQVCLTPDVLGNTGWKFVVNERLSLKTPDIPKNDGILGYEFMLRATHNLTKCARPAKSPRRPGGRFFIIMTTCQLEDRGQLWWFSESASQLKHRGLGLCIEALISEEGSWGILAPCSLARLNVQAWIFKQGPIPRDEDDLPGDFICLKSNHTACLVVKTDDDFGKDDELLSLVIKTRSRHWAALTSRGFFVPLAKMKDCVPPWMKMKDYRGSRSWTVDGIECQHWSYQWPHRHPFTNASQPSAGLEQNFCRKPQGIPSDKLDKLRINDAWCLTMNPTLPWQECSIARCPVNGVLLDTSNGFWEPGNGQDPYPFICQAMSECYFGNGVDYSGFYEHTGQGYCMNWRKYYGGDNNWPDHSRCMNWNNDTMKPWCWVQKGVAQYCELIVPCPKRCSDPSPKMRNMYISNINYASPSKLYMPKSSVQVTCRKGYNLTVPGQIHQNWTCNSNGEWKPEAISCRRIFCHPPADIDDAIRISRKTVFPYGAVAVYQCLSGFMIEPGKTLIEIKCLITGTWSRLPYTCVPTCRVGWTSFNDSCYKLFHDRKHYYDYQSAHQECSKKGSASLAVPQTQVQFRFLRDLVALTRGFTEEYYWIGIRETYQSKPKGVRVNSSGWIGDGFDGLVPMDNLYLKPLRNNSFMIRNYGSVLHKGKSIPYTDRCIFGDAQTKKVLTKSCMYNDGIGMQWMWATDRHLYNVDAELCLTATQHTGSPTIHTIPDSVFLEECGLHKVSQAFVCGPENGYFVRLKQHASSYLVLESTHYQGEIRIGSKKALGDFATWHTVPGKYYLCHWNMKKPDEIFLVHKDLSPGFYSFFGGDLDPCQENMTGAVVVNTTYVSSYMISESLDWCACAYVIDSIAGDLVNMMANSLGTCHSPELAPSPLISGLRPCKKQTFADSLCRLPEKKVTKGYPWLEKCVAVNAPTPEESHLTSRECRTALPGYICQESAKWICPNPIWPANSVLMFDAPDTENMKLTYKAVVEIRCKEGYWMQPSREGTTHITCNKYLNWEILEKEMREGDREFYTDTHKDREDMMTKIRCTKTQCTPPPQILGMKIISMTDIFNMFDAVVTYECLEGTWLSPGLIYHNMTCAADGTWQPYLPDDEICKTSTCPEPPPIRNANYTHGGLVFDSVATYTCHEGYWITERSKRTRSVCSTDGKWDPDHFKIGTLCVPITCMGPTNEMLSRANMFNSRVRIIYVHNTVVTIQCNPGYWFDRGAFSLNFTCDLEGKWQPFQPKLIHCKKISCRYPDEVPGATRFGSDLASGSRVRYYCGRRNWIRRRFQIYNPNWRFCMKLSNVIGPSTHGFSEKGARFGQLAFDDNCGDKATPYHWWIWRWSHHLQHYATKLCITAAAIPSLKEDYIPVTAEPCKKGNIFQMWTCSQGGNNEWMVRLYASIVGGYLATEIGSTSAKWGSKGNINVYVTGDAQAILSQNYWKMFRSADKSVSICLMKEGQFYEESMCSSAGEWYPDPRNFECKPVTCSKPKLPKAEVERKTSDSAIQAKAESYTRWENVSNSIMEFEVATKVIMKCRPGYWILRHMHGLEITCLDNSFWDPDPSKFECIDVSCLVPVDKNRLRKKVTFRRNPAERMTVSEMLEKISLLPRFKGQTSFFYSTEITFSPHYGDDIVVECLPGFWFPRHAIEKSYQDKVIPKGTEGTNFLEAKCLWDGTWSLTIIHDSLECVPLYCVDPGVIPNARRIDTINPSNDPIKVFQYNTILQYQCNMGFWFSVSIFYMEVRCSESAHWIPDVSTLTCTPVSCGDPGNVVNAIKFGEEYLVTSKVTYRCNAGFRIGKAFTEFQIQCLRAGKWYPPSYSIRCDVLECEDVPKVSNAYISHKIQKFKGKFTPEDEITLHCNDGYRLSHKSRHIVFHCGLQGKWTPSTKDNMEIDCTPAICPTPPIIQQSTIINQQLQYYVNDNVYYSCPEGNSTSDPLSFVNIATCDFALTPGAGGKLEYTTFWDPDPLNMKCSTVICPHPGLVTHSTLIINGYEYRNTAVYTCIRGYLFKQYNVSVLNIQCGRFGKWTLDMSVLQCHPRQCPPPVFLDGLVKVQPIKTLYQYADKIKLACPKDYWLKTMEQSDGPGEIAVFNECDEDGSWTIPIEVLICEPIVCNPPRAINNAFVTSEKKFHSKDFPVSSKLQITCDKGHILSLTGNVYSEFKCSGQGVWDPVDLYENPPICVPVACPDPGYRPNSDRHLDGLSFGSRVTFTALPGYYSLGSQKLRVSFICSSIGEWTQTLQVRRKRDTLKEAIVGDLLTFTPFECNFPSRLSLNVHIKVVNVGQKFVHGKTLTIHCNDGFLIALMTTSHDITCSEMGWNPDSEHIQCFPENTTVFCDLPLVIPNATYAGHSYYVGSTITVTCVAGFQMSPGSLSIDTTCTKGGIWSPSLGTLTCKVVSCTAPPAMPQATNKYSKLTYGSEAVYTCNKDYTFKSPNPIPSPNLYVRCRSSNVWHPDPSQYSCVLLDCGQPPNILFGNFKYTSTDYNSRATGTCEIGYRMSVSGSLMTTAQVTCNSHGFWAVDPLASELEVIRCVPLTCDSSSLPLVPNSHKFYEAKNFYKSKVLFRCGSGFETPIKTKLFTFECSHDGNWVPISITLTNAKCIEKICPVVLYDATKVDVLYLTTTGTFAPSPVRREYGAIINYNCKSGSKNTYTHQCQWHGGWEPPIQDRCEEVKCPQPPVMNFATSSGDKKLGSSWTYTCLTGYESSEHVNSVEMNCMQNAQDIGVWIPPYDSLLKCRLPSCERPRTFPPYTRVFDDSGAEVLASTPDDELNFATNSSLTIRCMEGYWHVQGATNIFEKESQCNSGRKWDPDTTNLLSCTMVVCQPPPDVPGFTLVQPVGGGHYVYNMSVMYECPVGTFLKALKKTAFESTCRANATFYPAASALSCEKTWCDIGMIPHTTVHHLAGQTLGDTLTYDCDDGYWLKPILAKRYVLVCGQDGKWFPKRQCEKAICGHPGIENMIYDESNVVKYQDEVKVLCKDGYHLSNPTEATMTTLVCGEDGQYTPIVQGLHCIPIPCDPPLALPSVTIYGDFFYGGKAHMQCDYGYSTKGHEVTVTAECQRDGKWSKNFQLEEYTCLPLECASLSTAENAAIQGGSGGPILGTHIKFSCLQGFWLGSYFKGNPNEVFATCSDTALWEPLKNLKCKRIICPKLPQIDFAKVFGDSNNLWFDNVVTYICPPLKWVAVPAETGWRMTGQKEFRLTCGKDAQWHPEPKFNCISLLDALPKETGHRKPPYRKISTGLPRKWLSFDPKLMTISDSKISLRTSTIEHRTTATSHRDAGLLWDANPLTFWVGAKDASFEKGEWNIDVCFGKPITLYAIMMMCVDDTVSNVGNFSIILADSRNGIKDIGPFKVYGDGLIQGKIVQDFPLRFAAMANAFVFDGIMEEVMWMHIVIRPLYDGNVPAVREIGFYASEAKWDFTYVSNPIAQISLALTFVLLALTLSPMLFLIDGRKQEQNILLLDENRHLQNEDQLFYRVRIQASRIAAAKCQLALQFSGSSGRSPVVYLRKSYFPPSMKNDVAMVFYFAGNDLENVGEIQSTRTMIWKDPEKVDDDAATVDVDEILEIKDIDIRKLDGSAYAYTASQTKVLKHLTSESFCLEKENDKGIGVYKNRRLFKAFCYNLFVSLFYPPPRSHFVRAECFLCFILVLCGGCFSTSYIQLFYHTHILGSPEVTSRQGFMFSEVFTALIGSSSSFLIPFLLRALNYAVNRTKLSSDGMETYDTSDLFDARTKLTSDARSALKCFLDLLQEKNVATSITGLNLNLASKEIEAPRVPYFSRGTEFVSDVHPSHTSCDAISSSSLTGSSSTVDTGTTDFTSASIHADFTAHDERVGGIKPSAAPKRQKRLEDVGGDFATPPFSKQASRPYSSSSAPSSTSTYSATVKPRKNLNQQILVPVLPFSNQVSRPYSSSSSDPSITSTYSATVKPRKNLNQQILVPVLAKHSMWFSIFHTCLSPFLIILIILLSACLISVGQQVDSLGAGNFVNLAVYSILFSLIVVLPLDMLVAILLFRERLLKS